jgi:hypothetical protein
VLAVVGVVTALAAPAALADGEEEGDRPRLHREKRGDRDTRREKWARRVRKMQQMRRLQMPLLRSAKVRKELARHREAMQDIAEAVKKLHEVVRKSVKDDTNPRDALAKHQEEANALATRLLNEYAKHYEAMAIIAKEAAATGTDGLAKMLLLPPRMGGDRPRLHRREGGDRPGDRPREGGDRPGDKPEEQDPIGENPFED